jgi:ankyrin repeat protein/Mg2+ and Co2+ transporter CorA
LRNASGNYWCKMPTHHATISYEQLAQVIDSRDLVTLNTAIKTHSESRERKYVLADALAICCEKGYHEVAHHLLVQEGAAPNLPSRTKQSKDWYPPLSLAIRHFHISDSKDDQSAGPHPQDAQGSAQLDSSHASERKRLLLTLLQHGASLTVRDSDDRNVLFHAKSNEIAELLLAARTDSEVKELLTQKDCHGNDALMWAIVQECDSAVSLNFIKRGADIRTVDNEHRTTLMNSSWRDRIELVKLLLEDRSIARMKDTRERNIWHHVAMDEKHIWDEGLVNLLLTIEEDDASVNQRDVQERTPLHKCSIFGTLTIAKALLNSKRATVDAAESNENKTALHFAAAHGKSVMVRLLIDHGAERLALCNGNMIPLHLACGCASDNVDSVNILLEEEAETQINARTEDNMTPLHIAADHGNIGIVKTLLATPGFANVNAQSQGGWTALHLACGKVANHSPDESDSKKAKAKTEEEEEAEAQEQEKNYLAVVQALLSAGSEVNKKSQTSRTALHLAAEFGHVEIVKLLLAQKDIQFAAKDSSGNTPLLDAAKSEQREEILPLLAPWTGQSIEALPNDIKQSARDFDANVIDFEKDAGTRPRRHKVPVFDLLYTHFSKPGAISRKNVSTIPDPAKKGSFRWIHLPANNLHWCHTLLTKHFIEGGFSDVDGFKNLERSLGQQQYRGKKMMHSQYMRPTCLAVSRQPEARDHGHTNDSCSEYDAGLNPVKRVNSLEVVPPEDAPPDPGKFTSRYDQDLTGFHHPELKPQENSNFRSLISEQIYRNRALTGQASGGSARGDQLASDKKTKPQTDLRSTPNEFSGAFLFMPYFALESRTSVGAMHERLPPKSRDATSNPVGSSGSRITGNPSEDRDLRLHQAYSNWKANDYGLHIRRTLDQFFYRNVDTRQRDDDQVVLRYQRRENVKESDENSDAPDASDQNFDVLMVDQLWIWVLGPGLIVTSFPQKWQQPRQELPDLLSSVLEKLDPRTGDPVQSIYGLAACIVGQCMSTCDRAMYQSHKESILDMFSGSVGDAMNEEVNLFSRFEKASVVASSWVKYTLLNSNMGDSKEMQDLKARYDRESHWTASRSGSSKDTKTQSRGDTDEPSFVEDLLDIQHETKLLKEVKDIQDELGILSQVTEDQQLVHKLIVKTFGPPLTLGADSSDQQKIDSILGEQHLSLEQQEIEITNMAKQVHIVYKSITDLLDHKQKHANAIEARYARKQASDTAKAGLTLMVFTTVTVVFLPLSFLAAFFAINIKELPRDEEGQNMSLAFVMRNVIGVGLGTALAFVLMAWQHHRVVPLSRKVGDWLAQKARLHELKQTIAGLFSGESRGEQTKGAKHPILAMGVVTESGLEHHFRKDRAQHDEEKAMNGSL